MSVSVYVCMCLHVCLIEMCKVCFAQNTKDGFALLLVLALIAFCVYKLESRCDVLYKMGANILWHMTNGNLCS